MPLYGFHLYSSPTVPANYEYPVIGKNSEAFAIGDPVAVTGTAGLQVFIAPASKTQSVIGIVAETITMSSDNQTVAKVRPAIIPIDQEYKFLAGTNSNMGGLTEPGQLFGLTAGPAGQVLVDTSAGRQTTSHLGIVECLDADPTDKGTTGVDGGAREGVFRFVRSVNKVTTGET